MFLLALRYPNQSRAYQICRFGNNDKPCASNWRNVIIPKLEIEYQCRHLCETVPFFEELVANGLNRLELEIKGEHKESKICVFSVDGLWLKLQDEEKLVMTVSFSARRKHQHHDWYIQTTASNFTEEEKVEYKIYRPRYVSTGYWAERFQTGTNNFEEIMSIVKDFITTLKSEDICSVIGFLASTKLCIGF